MFAVEASNLAKLSREVIKENQFENVIEVFECKIEEFQLPAGIEKVDIIISEWIGFYLLHEGMLDSVIFARDNFLKSGGLLFPDKAIIYLSPCSVPQRFDQWENLSGVKMTTFAEHLRLQKSMKPEILNIKAEDLLTDDIAVAFFDLNDLELSDLDEINFREVVIARKEGKFQGLCIWFECMFPCKDEDDAVILSTHPKAKSTHWKQTIILLPENIETLEPLTPVAFKLLIKRSEENSRRYNLLLEILNPEEEEHPLPCDCVMTKCILTKAHLAAAMNPEAFESA